MDALQPFQQRFLERALRPKIDLACLSLPRGNGKSWLAAHILTRCLTPGDPLHRPGAEFLLCAASREQARRATYMFTRRALEHDPDYRFLDSVSRMGITHTPTNTRLTVLSSNGKSAMGVVGVPLAVADEPGSWEVGGGELMSDALLEAQGKPGSNLRIIIIGTLAPATGGWWHQLIDDGSGPTTHVTCLRGDVDRWDTWSEIRRCNPLTSLPGEAGRLFRAKLRQRRKEARADSRLKARFCSYRLNAPTRDESKVVLTLDDWESVCDRPVPPREGKPVVGVDLGAGRAWSAAVAIWPNKRIEAFAVSAGLPDLAAQERRDRVHRGDYTTLADAGMLEVASGLHIPPVSQLVNRMMDWKPSVVIADRNRYPDSPWNKVAGGLTAVEGARI